MRGRVVTAVAGEYFIAPILSGPWQWSACRQPCPNRPHLATCSSGFVFVNYADERLCFADLRERAAHDACGGEQW